MDMTAVVALMRHMNLGKTKLPSINMSGGFGTALMKLASLAQPAGVGSYLRTHLGRVPRFDNSKISRELGITFTPPATSIKDTLADLARWGHIPAK
jgi:dihydroflavonol-4-reductase